MFYPGCTKEPKNGYKMEEIDKGVFAIPNAYDGPMEFFEGRPIVKPQILSGNNPEDKKE